MSSKYFRFCWIKVRTELGDNGSKYLDPLSKYLDNGFKYVKFRGLGFQAPERRKPMHSLSEVLNPTCHALQSLRLHEFHRPFSLSGNLKRAPVNMPDLNQDFGAAVIDLPGYITYTWKDMRCSLSSSQVIAIGRILCPICTLWGEFRVAKISKLRAHLYTEMFIFWL